MSTSSLRGGRAFALAFAAMFSLTNCRADRPAAVQMGGEPAFRFPRRSPRARALRPRR